MSFITIQTFITYTLILLILYVGSKKSCKTGKFKYVVSSIILVSIIFGLRYGVGTDCNTYIEEYEYLSNGTQSRDYEVGFQTLANCFSFLGAPSWLFMTGVAFIQLLFIFLAYKDEKYVYKYIAITLILNCTLISFGNGMRQQLAFCFFVASLPYAQNKQYIVHYLYILLAITMHNSAWLLIVMYPIARCLEWVPSIKIQYILLAVAIVLGNISFIQDYLGLIEQLAGLSGYDYYMRDEFMDMVLNTDSETTLGVGYFVILLTSIFIISKSKLLLIEMPKLCFIYDLFFVGILIKYALAGSLVLQRFNWYFYGFDFIVGAYLLYILYAKKQLKSFYSLIALYSLMFVGMMYRMYDNDSAYFFMWQQSEYHQLTHKY